MAINAHDVPRGIWRPIFHAALIAAGFLALALGSLPGHAQTVDIAAASQHPAVQAAVSACMPDRARLCAYVLPGSGRIVRCLAAMPEQLAPDCRAAMERARGALIAAGLATPAAYAAQTTGPNGDTASDTTTVTKD